MRASIRSLHNTRVKQAVRLRHRRGRQQQGRMLIDGWRELQRALSAGFDVAEVFVCPELLGDERAHAIHTLLRQRGLEELTVTSSVYERLAYGQRSEGVVGVARTPRTALADLAFKPGALVAVLEGVEKPGNIGAVVRSADGAGVSALILADGGTDLYNPNAIRASAGAIFAMPMCAATGLAALDWLRSHRIKIVAARVDGAVDYSAVSYRDASAIALGSETRGLTPLWSGPQVTSVKLPMCGSGDSLNVSAAAAILFYEALRQRRSA
jgi:TrmH family RNA methyltransferase